MGKNITGPSKPIIGGDNNPESTNTNDTTTTNNNSNPETGGTTAGGTTAGTDNNTSDKIEVVHRLVNGLNQQIPEPPKHKRTRRTKEQMLADGNNPPSSRSTASVKNESKDVTDMLTTFLVTVSSIGATKVGAHWVISKQEADAIAEPLSKILERLNLVDKLGAYADYIALGMALLIVVVPRAIMSLEISRRNGGTSNVREFAKPTRNESNKTTTTTSGQKPDERAINTDSRGIQQQDTDSNVVSTSIIEALSIYG